MIYLIYGEERYLVNRKLEEVKFEYESSNAPLSLGLNYIILNNLDSADELIDEIEIPPFGYEKKFIIVRESGFFDKGKTSTNYSKASSKTEDIETSKTENTETSKILEYLKDNKNILKTVDLVFVEYDINTNDLMSYIKKHGKIFKYNALTKQDNQQIIKILEEHLKELNEAYNKDIKISKFDLNYMVEEIGRDLYTLLNDLNKLFFYTYDKDRIEKSDIDETSTKSLDSMIYEISNNILASNHRKIVDLIDEQIYRGVDIYIILGYIYNVYKRMYLIALAEEDGENPAKILPANQSFLLPKFQQYIRRVGKKKVEEIMFEIMEIDKLSKNGEINAELAIKALLK